MALTTQAGPLYHGQSSGFKKPSFSSYRSTVVLTRVLSLVLIGLVSIPFSHAAPVARALEDDGPEAKPADDPDLWVYLGTAVALVLLGGVFAGLTIALMGQDEIYLQVIATSGEGSERKNARKVLNLLKKGKHWVLVTLLLGNVITNETLPIVLDRSLGGGWPAVLGSTILIVIFGEIAPQSVCVRFGLPIGAWMSPFVLVLMWLLAPVAWPTAKLLDYLLGEDHGTTYKKAGLKTLVTLHRTLGESPAERLNQDEVTIISAVLDLKDKSVGRIMTPMADVFTLSLDTVLDEDMMDTILSEGYSRIPIYAVNNPRDFVGMLLVKMLITYDPEDSLRVRDFQLATLPETRPETSCLDIVNFFQEGKSHMVLVSDYPGEPRGALGVVTLEDVIEELIGEEIVDESDVFIDVHKAIRRLHPAPFNRIRRVDKGEIITAPDPNVPSSELEGVLDKHSKDFTEGRKSRSTSDATARDSRKPSMPELSRSPTSTTFLMRRRSSGADPVQVRSNTPELRQQLKHLGPSNVASRPKQTRINTVKIKPGVDQMATLPETRQLTLDNSRRPASRAQSLNVPVFVNDDDASETTGLLSAGRKASDGAHAITYGALSSSPTAKARDLLLDISTQNGALTTKNDDETQASTPKPTEAQDATTSLKSQLETSPVVATLTPPAKLVIDLSPSKEDLTTLDTGRDTRPSSSRHISHQRSASTSTLGSLRSIDSAGDEKGSGSNFTKRKRGFGARSGSISEHVVEVDGVKKVILETTSSSDEHQPLERHEWGGESEEIGKENEGGDGAGEHDQDHDHEHEEGEGHAKGKGKKRRKKKHGKRKSKAGANGSAPDGAGMSDSQPLSGKAN